MGLPGTNEQSDPLYIYTSRVNDGVCDCCDGSDEWQADASCGGSRHDQGCRELLAIVILDMRRLRLNHRRIALSGVSQMGSVLPVWCEVQQKSQSHHWHQKPRRKVACVLNPSQRRNPMSHRSVAAYGKGA